MSCASRSWTSTSPMQRQAPHRFPRTALDWDPANGSTGAIVDRGSPDVGARANRYSSCSRLGGGARG